MIRRLSKEDHEVCFALLKKKPAENLFIIGDIEAYGYDKEFQKLWGDFNEAGELMAVLLKYEFNYIPFAEGPFNAKGFAEIISSDSDMKMMSGLKEVTEQIEPYVTRTLKKKRPTYYAKCTKLNEKADEIDISDVQQATVEDVEEIVDVLKAIPEFSESMISAERKKRQIQDGISRSYFVKENGNMVSTASTTAENSLSAMVMGVATLATHKKKGYATKCVVKICKELLNDKELCLFYDNPEAGAIYKRIGFEDIGLWMMYSYEN